MVTTTNGVVLPLVTDKWDIVWTNDGRNSVWMNLMWQQLCNSSSTLVVITALVLPVLYDECHGPPMLFWHVCGHLWLARWMVPRFRSPRALWHWHLACPGNVLRWQSTPANPSWLPVWNWRSKLLFWELWVLWTWIDWTSVYFHDCTLTCCSVPQFEKHLPTACRAVHQQHLFVSLLPCFSAKSWQRNTLNWWKYCSKMYLRVNCCCCNCVTTCCVETWRIMAWRQILWRFYVGREFCDIFMLTTCEFGHFMSWSFSIVCGGGMVMRVHSHWEIFRLGWWEYTHTKKFSNLSWHWNTTRVMRVHSHWEIFRFGWWEYTHTKKFLIYLWHWSTTRVWLRRLAQKVVFILQDDEYGSQVSYGEYPEEWRERFECGDSGSVSVIERYRLHLSILVQYLRIVEVSTESASDVCFWRRRHVEYSSRRLSSIFWQWARAAGDILSIPWRCAWWCCLASSPFVGVGLLGEYELNCTRSDSQCPS